MDGRDDLRTELSGKLTGRFGFYTWGNSGVEIKNVRLTP
jgi:hypothetical protein